MTARNQPHKYRCETCKNPDCPFGVEAKYCVRIIPNIMHKVGCASHSDAVKAEQRIADELLKLIKDMGENDNCGPLWEMNSDECYSFNNSCALCKAAKALEQLREKGE